MQALTKISKKTPKIRRPEEKTEYSLVTSLRKTPFVLDKKKKFSIGRNRKNNLVIPQQTTSEVNSSLKWGKSSFKLKDEKSTNGTFLNNKRINNEVSLKNGDRIKVGKFTIIYKAKKIRIKKEVKKVNKTKAKAKKLSKIKKIKKK
jgi:pSer/pThr/pTyr-binding forkhead associated (FHA) protein